MTHLSRKPLSGGVARIVTDPHEANRQDPHRPMRDDTGGGRTAAPPRVAAAEPSGACPCSAASARHVALLHERPSAGGAVWPALLVSAGATLQGCSRRFIPRIRRSTAWRIGRPTTGEGLHLVLDSTGLSIVGAGEWAAAKHGGRGQRGWRKLHLGVDQSGVILVHTLTEATGEDATTGLDLLNAVDGPLVRVTADAAYDTVAVYETATVRGATLIIPPAKTANISGHGPLSPARDRTITWVKTLGRRRWKQASGYHRQGRVENAFFRYKSIIGDGLRARSPAGQGSEAVLGCEILNRMTALGRPVSYRIGR